MARVTVEDCVDKIPNRYELLMVAAQRAKDISAGAPITVARDNDKNPVIALREIADETVSIEELQKSLVMGLQKYVEGEEPEEEELEIMAAEKELADLIYKYGEERKSRQIAARIAERRRIKPIETTKELAEIIYTVIHKTPNAIDPATRTFQALRIAVNDELGELERGLDGAAGLIVPGGRLVVVSFHSLEDRIVKSYFKEKSGKNSHVSRYMPEPQETDDIIFASCSKAIEPSQEETRLNKRSRSAKLRYAVKK